MLIIIFFQQWNPSVTATTPGFPSRGTAQVSQAVNPALLGATSAVASQAAPVEIKSSGRKQLPEASSFLLVLSCFDSSTPDIF